MLPASVGGTVVVGTAGTATAATGTAAAVGGTGTATYLTTQAGISIAETSVEVGATYATTGKASLGDTALIFGENFAVNTATGGLGSKAGWAAKAGSYMFRQGIEASAETAYDVYNGNEFGNSFITNAGFNIAGEAAFKVLGKTIVEPVAGAAIAFVKRQSQLIVSAAKEFGSKQLAPSLGAGVTGALRDIVDAVQNAAKTLTGPSSDAIERAAKRNNTPSPALEGTDFHPDVVNERIRPRYETNPAHSQGSSYNSRKTPEPIDAPEVYRTAVRINSYTWLGLGENNQVYRFFHDNADSVHFSGFIDPLELTPAVRKQLGL